MTTTLHQSSWRRAKRDTWSAQTTNPLVWLGQGALSLTGLLILPRVLSDTAITQTVVSVIGGAGGPIIVFLAVGLWNLFRAPYRQRDEARRQLESKPKPLPLPNRQQLLEAIADTRSAALKYGSLKRRRMKANAVPLTNSEVKTAFDKATSALELLRKQELVAGIDYQPVIARLHAAIWVEIMNLSIIGKLPDPWTFNSEVDNAISQAVQEIEELNRLATESHHLT